MTRSDFQGLARLRLREARVLLRAKEYAGAYYLVGYAVECALKACIAKQTRRHDFPSKTLANDCYSHNLPQLIKTAGLSPALEQLVKTGGPFAVNWALVKDWSVEDRYSLAITETD